MVPSIGFGIPVAGLFVGLVVMLVGIFMGGLTPVAFAGIAIAFAGIVALLLAVVSAPRDTSERGERATDERAH
ncbi:hypothetical protein [Halovivax limisalsi]|uniref:hypothetical protein n=1 Tax=Halovivax limisalsi TaxID=1453760 RepID=UPI001FFD4F4D|nr:hypothetical protein [Halovivax limisalsi]